MEIGSVYARLSANIGNFQQNIKKAGDSLDTLSKKTEGLRSKMSNVGQGVGEVTSQLGSKLGAGLSQAGGFVTDLAGKVLGLAKNLAIGLVGAFTAVSAYGMKMGNSIQQTAIAFDTMLGDPDKRRKLMQEITDFAKNTPFERFELIDASKLLLAMGVSADAIIPSMQMLGDISAGVGANVKDVAFVFGQVKAQGQAYTQDLNQFASRGIPIYEELGKVLGVSVATLRDGMGSNKIKVGFEDVNTAFRKLTAEGGKFNNLMDKQSRSLGGILSNLKDGFDNIILTFMGITSEGDVKSGSFFDLATEKAQQFQGWLSANEEIIGQWGARVFTAIGTGMEMAWTAMVLPVLQDFQAWFNSGGKEAIKAFLSEGWRQFLAALVIFTTEIYPKVKEAFSDFFEWIKSEEGKQSLRDMASLIGAIAAALASASQGMVALNNAMQKAETDPRKGGYWNQEGSFLGMAGNLLKGRGINDYGSSGGSWGGQKANGGPVRAGKMYEVGENNKAEMLMMNGKQYMIPGNNGQVLNQSQMGGGSNNTFNISGSNPMEIAKQIERVLARQNNLARNGINV